MWNIGDRVLAHRGPGVYWYLGTVRHIDGDRYYVIFEDGNDAFVAREQIGEGRFDIGDQIFAHSQSAGDYLQGRVCEVGESDLLVRFSNGNEKRVALSEVRIHPETWKSRTEFEEREAPAAWSVGDRVLACAPDLNWYPGLVLNAEPDRIHVFFDVGEQSVVAPNKIRPLQLHEGDVVACRLRAGPEYFPGRITSIKGETIEVNYDNGFSELTLARLVRLNRDEWFSSNSRVPISAGQRVLAQWHDLNWYPGVIVWVDGRRLQLAYFDGDQGLVTPDQVRELEIEVGSRVWCRSEETGEYRLAEVISKQGDTLRVRLDEGNTEYTSLRMVRVESQA